MCTFHLTTLTRTCGHELPTLSYCSAARSAVKAYERAQKVGKLAVKPPKTCTDSYGWMLYKSLEIPVSCGSCVEWLSDKGKRTYGGVVAAEAEGRSGGERKRKVKFEGEDDVADAEGSDGDDYSDAGLGDDKRIRQKDEGLPVAFYAPPTPGQQRRNLHMRRNW